MAGRRVCALTVVVVTMLIGVVGMAMAAPLRETAYNEAVAGASATRIMHAAFPGGIIKKVPPRTIRVLVADIAPSVVIEGQTTMTIVDQGHGTPTQTVPAHQQLQITPVISGGVIVGETVTKLDVTPPSLVTMTGPVLVRSTTSLRMDQPTGFRFRGALQIRAGNDHRTLTVINDASVEGYADGVLAGQVPSTWGPRAAQAVVASAIAVRSRALATMNTTARQPFDVTADNPVYLGIDGERATTNAAAVKSTGKVLEHKGRVMNVGFVGIAPIVFAPRPGRPDFVANGPAKPIPGATPNEAARAIALASSMLHHPYVFGGATPGGFDCSGLMYWIWQTNLGVSIPRDASSQSKVGYAVQRNDLQPGDLVFFSDSSGYVNHDGIYIGNNAFLAAANPGLGVRIDSLTAGYYAATYAGARRYSLSK